MKIKCIESNVEYFTKHKTYDIIDELIVDDQKLSWCFPNICFWNNASWNNSEWNNIYKKIAKFEEVKEMTKQDLKVGYVVQHKNGNFAMVMEVQDGLVLATIAGHYVKLEDVQDDLTINWDDNYSIIKIYGFKNSAIDCLEISSNRRPILWVRKETKKMTVSEICKELGYDVEIIKEENNNV